jgi:hypothetical protein
LTISRLQKLGKTDYDDLLIIFVSYSDWSPTVQYSSFLLTF